MSKCFIVAALTAAFLLGGCATSDPYTGTHSFSARYEQYRPSVVELARLRTGDVFDYEISDVDIVNYTDHVKSVLRSKFTNARLARYTSATGQILLSGLAGAAAAFDASSTTVAALALSSAALPQIGGVFNAKARAESYQDAVRLIEEAEIDYLNEVGSPSAKELTANGVDLYRRVTATVHIVEKAIVGQIPTLREMKDVSGETMAKPLRAKRVIKVLSGKTNAATTATAMTVVTKPADASLPIDATFPTELDPPSRRPHASEIHPPAAGGGGTADSNSKAKTSVKGETSKIPDPLVSRNARLESAIKALSDADAKKLLVAQGEFAPEGTLPKEYLAEAICSKASLAKRPNQTWLQSLTFYREHATDEASMAKLEAAYRKYSLLPAS